MSKFTDINIYLSSTWRAIQLDRNTFTNWERKEISTHQALKEFRQHNMIRNSVFIGEGHFAEWMRSLGYLRGNY